MLDLSSLTGDQTHAPAVEAQSPNHWEAQGGIFKGQVREGLAGYVTLVVVLASVKQLRNCASYTVV